MALTFHLHECHKALTSFDRTYAPISIKQTKKTMVHFTYEATIQNKVEDP